MALLQTVIGFDIRQADRSEQIARPIDGRGCNRTLNKPQITDARKGAEAPFFFW